MQIPVVRGVIDRRLLVNFRVEAEALAKVLPKPFRPKLVHGWGMAGICLIRLKNIRPRGLPAFLGISSENAAHRIAVEWDEGGGLRSGVFIPRRDTSSRLNRLVGGTLFPGVHHLADFQVLECGDFLRVGLDGDDGKTHVLVEGRVGQRLPSDSVFSSLDEASEFFRTGSLGYSASAQPSVFDGLELRPITWHVEPVAVGKVESSFFADEAKFPKGSVRFDCALLMRGIEHEWHGREPMGTATNRLSRILAPVL